MAEPGFPRRFGKYILLDQLAAGGMAEVFLAKVSGVESFERLIAIKCMRPELAVDEEFASMFVDEANLAGQLRHANIAQIYELGRFKEQLYIAMELIEGRDLRSVLEVGEEKETNLPVWLAAYIIRCAAMGLDYAHRKVGSDGNPLNLVHRDISPPNLLLTWEGEVKVVDFGIAKASERSAETRVGVLKGKFAYMAPEQVSGLDVDRRTDIFTLGTVLYELITGAKLFAAETEFEVLEKVRGAVIPDLRQTLPDAPPELISTLYNALSREPGKRFQYASEMAKALESLLIQDRSIFGAAEASAFLQSLYGAEEVKRIRQSHQSLLRESPHDVEEEDDSWQGKTETFHSAFGKRTSDSAMRAVKGMFDSSEGRRLTSPFEEDDGDDEDVPLADDDQNPDFWRQPTSELNIRKLEAAASYDEDDVPNEDENEDQNASDALSQPSTDPLQSYGSEHHMPEPSRGFVKELISWSWVLALFIVAGGLGFVWYQQQPPPEEVEGVTDSDTQTDGSDDGTTDAGPSKTKSREFGFVSIKVKGSKGANVYIDGKRVGTAPIKAFKVRTGSHTIKVEDRKKKKKTKTRKVSVGKSNTKKSPVSVTMNL